MRDVGRSAFEPVWARMREFTDSRQADTADEIWRVEHDPVFTLGQAGRPEHVLDAGEIPLVATDRGGQVTYHGPGQLVLYVLIDLRRRGLGVRDLVSALERGMIGLLAAHGVSAYADPAAPGVYVEGRKVGALGLRVRRGCSYHGLSLNVDMDLSPFARINPCGYPGLEVVQTRDLGIAADIDALARELVGRLADQLGYNRAETDPAPNRVRAQ